LPESSGITLIANDSKLKGTMFWVKLVSVMVNLHWFTVIRGGLAL